MPKLRPCSNWRRGHWHRWFPCIQTCGPQSPPRQLLPPLFFFFSYISPTEEKVLRGAGCTPSLLSSRTRPPPVGLLRLPLSQRPRFAPHPRSTVGRKKADQTGGDPCLRWPLYLPLRAFPWTFPRRTSRRGFAVGFVWTDLSFPHPNLQVSAILCGRASWEAKVVR